VKNINRIAQTGLKASNLAEF